VDVIGLRIADGDKKRRAAKNLTRLGREIAESLRIARSGHGKMA